MENAEAIPDDVKTYRLVQRDSTLDTTEPSELGERRYKDMNKDLSLEDGYQCFCSSIPPKKQ